MPARGGSARGDGGPRRCWPASSPPASRRAPSPPWTPRPSLRSSSTCSTARLTPSPRAWTTSGSGAPPVTSCTAPSHVTPPTVEEREQTTKEQASDERQRRRTRQEAPCRAAPRPSRRAVQRPGRHLDSGDRSWSVRGQERLRHRLSQRRLRDPPDRGRRLRPPATAGQAPGPRPPAPNLLHRQRDACRACGLCVVACPEHAVALVPTSGA